MKKLFFVCGIFMLSYHAIGQARDGTAALKNSSKDIKAAMINLPYSPSVVQLALTDYLSKTTKEEQKIAQGFLLSCNTVLVKKNIDGSAMDFLIGEKDYYHPNETVLYLKLNSNVGSLDKADYPANGFDMIDAIGYLENLAIAIKPYATDLQIKFQKEDLNIAQKRSISLNNDSVKIEKRRVKILNDMSSDNSKQKTARLVKSSIENKKMARDNIAAKSTNRKEINEQIYSIVLLENRNKQ